MKPRDSEQPHDAQDAKEDGLCEPSGATAGVWRAIDASANRAGEALRVVEDVVRFVLNDAQLTALAKDLRHTLATLLAQGALPQRVALRDVAGDIGIGVEPPVSLRRASPADLVAANTARAAQALRSLTECTAVVAPEAAAGFEHLRYRLYGLERRALAAARARGRLAGISLCVLVDGRADLADFERLMATLVEAGVRMFQIRDKALGIPELAVRVEKALAMVRRHAANEPAIVVVNDRADLAAAVNADGVHTGTDDLPATLVRRVIGPAALLGRTAHSVAEARAAAADGADYLGIGPCFPSSTKSFGECAPPDFLETVSREISLPAFAIGGVTLDRLDALAALGVTRVAVASAVTGARDPAAAAAALIARLAALQALVPSPLL